MSACSDSVVFAIGVPISNDERVSLRRSDLRSGGIVLDDLFVRAQRSAVDTTADSPRSYGRGSLSFTVKERMEIGKV